MIKAVKLLAGLPTINVFRDYPNKVKFLNRCAAHSIQLVINYGIKNGVVLNQDQKINTIFDKIR